jgi:O-antigen ligase
MSDHTHHRLAIADRAALIAALLMPVFMLHAFVLAEAAIALICIVFLTRSAILHEWQWVRHGWFPLAMVWWLWLVFCSLPVPGLGQGGMHSLTEALVVLRYLVLMAALEHRVLRDPGPRRWMAGVVTACAAYIALQTLIQFSFGANLFGAPRWGDGELTGPFTKPRAAAPLSRLFFPALLPALGALLQTPTLRRRLAAGALTTLALAVVILIGQRMPLLLTIFGMLVSALLLRQLRTVTLAALLAGGVLLAASPIVAPPTFYRLVTKFSTQMENFPNSPYGLLAARAVAMVEQRPWTGRGYDGFRTGCADPRYFHGWTWPNNPADDGGGLAGCNIHPHNHYLQAATDSGLPGLVLFAALVLSWLVILGRGLWRDPEPLRVGLFVATLVQQWPLASTSNAFAIELGGLSFLLLGFGLAVARHGVRHTA